MKTLLPSLLLASILLTGCQTTDPKPIASTVQDTEAWITANILPGLPGFIAGGSVLAANQLIKSDDERKQAAAECYAIAKLVRSLMGGGLPDSVAIRKAIESAGGGGPLLDLTAIADMVGGYIDPYLAQVQGDQNVKFAMKFLEAVAAGFEKGAATLLKQ